jgi:hypothetical protein
MDGAAIPAARTPAPLMIARRDGASLLPGLSVSNVDIVPPLNGFRRHFLISAVIDTRVSFCEHWSNGCDATAAQPSKCAPTSNPVQQRQGI